MRRVEDRGERLVGLLQSFAVYAVGFLALPKGAAIFGHYSDRVGCKAALIATLLPTGLATFAVGFAPTHHRSTPKAVRPQMGNPGDLADRDRPWRPPKKTGD